MGLVVVVKNFPALVKERRNAGGEREVHTCLGGLGGMCRLPTFDLRKAFFELSLFARPLRLPELEILEDKVASRINALFVGIQID